jgi:hypothetical protein
MTQPSLNLLAGDASGQPECGRHNAYPEGTPMADFLLTVLDRVGIPTPELIGNSSEHLPV